MPVVCECCGQVSNHLSFSEALNLNICQNCEDGFVEHVSGHQEEYEAYSGQEARNPIE